MAKRVQEQKEEESSVAKSKSTAMNLSSYVPTSSSIREKSDCILKSWGYSQRRGNPRADWEEFRNPTQRRVLKRLQDAYFDGLMEMQRGDPLHLEEEDSEDL